MLEVLCGSCMAGRVIRFGLGRDDGSSRLSVMEAKEGRLGKAREGEPRRTDVRGRDSDGAVTGRNKSGCWMANPGA